MKKLIYTAIAVSLSISSVIAEGPGSWPKRPNASDEFSWLNQNKWGVHQRLGEGADDFRKSNARIVGLGGSNKGLQIVMKTEKNNANDYTGAWVQSKIGYWRVGWWQARLKLDWTRNNVWPTWWMWTRANIQKGGDELDVMQFQTESLDQNHVKHWFPNKSRWIVGKQYSGYSKKGRYWNAWHKGKDSTAAWEHDWAMARCKNWTNWAVKVVNNQNARFFINGNLEHTGDKVWNGMNFIFSGTPQFNWLPAKGSSLPSMRIDWLRGHHP